MNLMEFNQRFPDELSAMMAVKQIREKHGVICRKCAHDKHFWQQTIESFQCKQCGARQRLRSGTMMEQSKLSYRMWLMAIHLVTATKKSFSSLELQRQLGHSRYEPVWYMLHKIRSVMGKRDATFKLAGYIELDDAFFEIADPHQKPNKAGRGSTGKAGVLVAVESQPTGNQYRKKNRNQGRKCGKLSIQVVPQITGSQVTSLVEAKIDPTATVHTDGLKSYNVLAPLVERHHITISNDPKRTSKLFPWVHTAISNAKRVILGIHHSVHSPYLQNYLNEFCWKFNRRYDQNNQFERLLNSGLQLRWC
jgi:transposase-like protein